MKAVAEYRKEFSDKCTEVIEDGENTVLYFKWYVYLDCFKEIVEAIRQEQREACVAAVNRVWLKEWIEPGGKISLDDTRTAILQAGKED